MIRHGKFSTLFALFALCVALSYGQQASMTKYIPDLPKVSKRSLLDDPLVSVLDVNVVVEEAWRFPNEQVDYLTTCQFRNGNGNHREELIGVAIGMLDMNLPAGLIRVKFDKDNGYEPQFSKFYDLGSQYGFSEKTQMFAESSPLSNKIAWIVNNITHSNPSMGLELNRFTGLLIADLDTGIVVSTPDVGPLGTLKPVMASIAIDKFDRIYYSDSSRGVIYGINADGSNLRIWSDSELYKAGYRTSINGCVYRQQTHSIICQVLGKGSLVEIAILADGSAGEPVVLFENPALAGGVELEMTTDGKYAFAGRIQVPDGLIRYNLAETPVTVSLIQTTGVPVMISQLYPIERHANKRLEGCLLTTDLGFAEWPFSGSSYTICPSATHPGKAGRLFNPATA